jgi:hypothetical protein
VVGFRERSKLRPAYPDTAVQPGSVLVIAGAPLTSETVLTGRSELVMLGSQEQRTAFNDAFGKA